jgi:hypothetical protein
VKAGSWAAFVIEPPLRITPTRSCCFDGVIDKTLDLLVVGGV